MLKFNFNLTSSAFPLRWFQVTIVEDRYSSSELSSSDVDEPTTKSKQKTKKRSSSSSSSSSSSDAEGGDSKQRKGILKKGEE